LHCRYKCTIANALALLKVEAKYSSHPKVFRAKVEDINDVYYDVTKNGSYDEIIF